MTSSIKFVNNKRNTLNKSLDETIDYMNTIGFTLHEHQIVGIKWMLEKELGGSILLEGENTIRGGLLCDVPGLGKTIQTCATMWANNISKTLLIVPNAVVNQWVDAIQKILPNKTIYIHHGTSRCKSIKEFILKKADITITTISMISNRQNTRTLLHHYINWGRIIIDEVHYIRNSKSKGNMMACLLTSPIKWGLTGTPIQNSEYDLFSLYKYIGVPQQYLYLSNIKEVNQKMLLRRNKEVFRGNHISQLFYNDHMIKFVTEEERSIYYSIRKNISDEYLQLMGRNVNSRERSLVVLELLLRLRQASIHPHIAMNSIKRKFKMGFRQSFSGIPSKIISMIDAIKQTGNDLCLVFCQFKDEMNVLESEFHKQGIYSLKYDGTMNIAQRQQVINQFSTQDTQTELDALFSRIKLPHELEDHIKSYLPKVMLIQINAGGVGLNLQQFKHVFITSPNWNPSNEIQAVARAHRIGQKHPVHVHRFILYDQKEEFLTIDQYISDTQNKKLSIMSEILNDDSINNVGINSKLNVENLLIM